MKFGNHVPTAEHKKRQPSPFAVFTRGEDALVAGTQWKFKFPNGYGASVIDDGYGARQGLYELAVLDLDGHLTYDTPITDDVLGFLTEAEVAEALSAIAALDRKVHS